MARQLWEIQLMGALVVSRKGESITHFPTEKVGLLLAYLAVFPQTVQLREELAERFWPESKPEDGRVSLRQALASLRRLLEPPGEHELALPPLPVPQLTCSPKS